MTTRLLRAGCSSPDSVITKEFFYNTRHYNIFIKNQCLLNTISPWCSNFWLVLLLLRTASLFGTPSIFPFPAFIWINPSWQRCHKGSKKSRGPHSQFAKLHPTIGSLAAAASGSGRHLRGDAVERSAGCERRPDDRWGGAGTLPSLPRPGELPPPPLSGDDVRGGMGSCQGILSDRLCL